MLIVCLCKCKSSILFQRLPEYFAILAQCYLFHFFIENFVHNGTHCIARSTILRIKPFLVKIADCLDFVFD